MSRETETANERDNGGMTGKFLVVNRATGQVVTDLDDLNEAEDIREGCEEDSPSHGYLIAEVRPVVASEGARAEGSGLDARATILAHLRGEVEPHVHSDYPCDCGPEDFGLSDEMADAISVHHTSALARVSSQTGTPLDGATLLDHQVIAEYAEFLLEPTTSVEPDVKALAEGYLALVDRVEALTTFSAPTPSREATEPVGFDAMLDEMVKQMSLGHLKFCAGIHVHDDGQQEEEWIEWKDAFAILESRRASAPREPSAAMVEKLVNHHRQMLTAASYAAMSREDIEASCQELRAALSVEGA